MIGSTEQKKVDPIVKNEVLMLNVNSCATVGIVREVGKKKIKCQLRKPICAQVGDKMTISRRVGTRFRLIGFGTITE
jgi:translation initiation factor 2 subunit 3